MNGDYTTQCSNCGVSLGGPCTIRCVKGLQMDNFSGIVVIRYPQTPVSKYVLTHQHLHASLHPPFSIIHNGESFACRCRKKAAHATYPVYRNNAVQHILLPSP